MRLSNKDKHITIVRVADPNIKDFVGDPNFRASTLGDKVAVFSSSGAHIYQTPCLLEPYHLFACRDGNWVLFLAQIDDDKHRLGLTKFAKNATNKVSQLISDFYALL